MQDDMRHVHAHPDPHNANARSSEKASNIKSLKDQKVNHVHYADPHPQTLTNTIMVVRIRLARFGKRHAPFYNIVVTQARYVPLLEQI
jgi:hypothetical protein